MMIIFSYSSLRNIFDSQLRLSQNLTVCVCVCVCPTSPGALQGRHKWSNLSEIWHIYSLGKSQVVLFSCFENFHFWSLRTWSCTLNEPKTFGTLQGSNKWLNPSEIWHKYSLGESLGCFFSFFENLHIRALGTRSWTLNGPKSFCSREGINGQICLKFATFGQNPWGCVFHFLKIFIFGPWGP